jgi:antitoxin HigA-1
MTGQDNFQFPLTSNGVYVLSGRTETHTMSKSQTTTNPEWLHNSHAGELLVSEFMEPLGLTAEVLAAPLGVEATRLVDVIDGNRPIDADLDLRLSRYFRMSEGFFLGLQLDHDLLEAKRALNGELERIVPLAA